MSVGLSGQQKYYLLEKVSVLSDNGTYTIQSDLII